MIPFTHWRSGIIWGFGTIIKRTGQPPAWGPFSYIVAAAEEPVMRWTCLHKGDAIVDFPGPLLHDYFGALAWAVGRHQ